MKTFALWIVLGAFGAYSLVWSSRTMDKLDSLERSLQAIERTAMTLHAEWKSGGVTYSVDCPKEEGETPGAHRARFAEMVTEMKVLFPPDA